MRLGKIKRITDIRSVWHHEEKDFSKWLAQEENLKQLSDAIGIDIVLEERESSVGNFSVDLYALEEGTERRIIIENQLEDTNHDHLGKLITYASGKGAEVIIWVVKRARDEHRQAIEWLNQNTGVNIGFFLVEIELWQIDDSAIAPKFNVVERPNDWAKQMKNADGLSETKQLQLHFWQQLSEFIKSNSSFSKEFSPRKAQPQHWYDLSVGSSNFHICMTASRQKRELSVGLYIDSDKSIYYRYQSMNQQIEEELGMKVQWREANKASRFLIARTFDIDDKQSWDDGINWLYKMCCKFKELVEKYNRQP